MEAGFPECGYSADSQLAKNPVFRGLSPGTSLLNRKMKQGAADPPCTKPLRNYFRVADGLPKSIVLGIQKQNCF
jgi:hypothetical protein